MRNRSCILRFELPLRDIKNITMWLSSNGYPCLIKLSHQRKWTRSGKACAFFGRLPDVMDGGLSVDIKIRTNDVAILTMFEPRVVQKARRIKAYTPQRILRKYRYA